MRAAIVVVLAAVLLAGCSSRQVYDSAQGWRQNECNKIVDPDKQRACLEEADKPYDTYKKEKDAGK